MDFRYDAFISYSSRDHEFARRLVRQLGRRGTTGFMDQADVASGALFSDTLREAIEQSRAMILLLSESALVSNWVMAEVGFAQSLNRPILPVIAPRQTLNFDEIEKLLGPNRLYIDAGQLRIEDVADRLVAGVRGVPLNEFLSQAARQRRQRRVGAALALLLVGLLLKWLLL